jgi:hypothetical protein
MLFINPMWDHESERIGKQKCTPLGYALHVTSDLIGFVALLLLMGTGAYIGYRGIAGTFHARLLWLFVAPFALAFVGSVLYRYSWRLAHKKGFRYDYDSREAIWLD